MKVTSDILVKGAKRDLMSVDEMLEVCNALTEKFFVEEGFGYTDT